MISPYEIFPVHAPYTYIQVIHLTFVEESSSADSVQLKKEDKTQHIAIFLRIVS